eukprot:TRINITY_DN7191_c0_g1_i1.p1 TRINITY_DN7191_c0_g1~~TRINITY_DN7191_c0_g1_i1.p1  ORF type:complete len:557 (-),score=100.03 TRINITY_DN7191_c0_g1_i1:13-1683(-)
MNRLLIHTQKSHRTSLFKRNKRTRHQRTLKRSYYQLDTLFNQKDDISKEYTSFLFRGIERLKEGKDSEAQELLKIAAQVNPTGYECYTYLAMIAKDQNNGEEYKRNINRAVRAARLDVKENKDIIIELYYSLAGYHFHEKEYNEGLNAMNELLMFADEPTADMHALRYELDAACQRVESIKYPAEKIYQAVVAPVLEGMPVEVKLVDETKGRGLFTTQDFEKGDIVLEETPILSVPSFSNLTHDLCYSTLAPLKKHTIKVLKAVNKEMVPQIENDILDQLTLTQPEPVSCPNCRFQFFNAEEEQEARKTYLSTCTGNCRNDITMKPCFPSVLEPELRRDETDEDEFTPFDAERTKLELISKLLAIINEDYSVWHKVNQSLCWLHDSTRSLLLHEVQYINRMKKKFPKISNLLTETNYIKLKSVVDVNGLQISPTNLNITATLKDTSSEYSDYDLNVQEDQTVDGLGLYIASSFINHSCEPNIEISQHSNSTLRWIATENIPKGTELLHAYITKEEIPDPEYRMAALKHRWNFLCHCPSCAHIHKSQPDKPKSHPLD